MLRIPPASIFNSDYKTMKDTNQQHRLSQSGHCVTNHDSAEFSCDGNLGRKSNHSTGTAGSSRSTSSWEELYDRSRSLKAKIQRKPVPRITVHVETPDDQTFTFTGFHPMDAILRIKQRLSTKVDIPPGQISLFRQGVKLSNDDTTTLVDASIKNGCTLELQRMMISVRMGREEVVKVPVSPDMAVWELQIYLEEKFGIDEDELLGHNGLILDEQERTLEAYRIKENATLEVVNRL